MKMDLHLICSRLGLLVSSSGMEHLGMSYRGHLMVVLGLDKHSATKTMY